MVNTRKFRAAMVEAGYSQTSLAAEMGWCKNTASAKINNRSDMTITEAKKICTLFSISDNTAKVEIFFA